MHEKINLNVFAEMGVCMNVCMCVVFIVYSCMCLLYSVLFVHITLHQLRQVSLCVFTSLQLFFITLVFISDDV